MVAFFQVIRNDVGDDLPLGSGQLFSNSQLQRFMERSLVKINGVLATTFVVDASGVVTPTTSDKQDDAIILCTECLIAKREVARASRDAIRAKQDENSIDNSVGLGGLRDWSKSVCEDAKLKLDELRRETIGAADHGQIIWVGTERLDEDVDFDNTGDGNIESINKDLGE